MLDYALSFKGETKKVNTKNVEYNLYLIAHNGSGFDSYVVLNNLPQWRCAVKLFGNGAGIVPLRKFIGDLNAPKFFLKVGEFILIIV